MYKRQVFVPDFNAVAMENPGCVTLRDALLYRGAATPDEVLRRSRTVCHEMAHMWFGDLVTMKSVSYTHLTLPTSDLV